MTDPAAHPEFAALLAGIRAAPDDDAPRLVMADWLEEHAGVVACSYPIRQYEDEPHFLCPGCDDSGFVTNGYADRAAFIRLQVKRAAARRWHRGRCRPGFPCPKCFDEWSLLLRYWRTWFQPAVLGPELACVNLRIVGPGTPAVEFRRGFVHAVTCTAADWLAHGPAVVTWHPVAAVTLAGCVPLVEGGWYCWWGESRAFGGPALPRRVWERLRGDSSPGGFLCRYPTRVEALAAASRACIAWALAAQPAPA